MMLSTERVNRAWDEAGDCGWTSAETAIVQTPMAERASNLRMG
jgi:hypothetical protein